MFLPTNITLKLGDSGDFVTELQRRLAKVDCFGGDAVNGHFDGATVNGVSMFQSMHGIRADGIAGPETLRRLNGSISGDFASTHTPLGGGFVQDPLAGVVTTAIAATAAMEMLDANYAAPTPTFEQHQTPATPQPQQPVYQPAPAAAAPVIDPYVQQILVQQQHHAAQPAPTYHTPQQPQHYAPVAGGEHAANPAHIPPAQVPLAMSQAAPQSHPLPDTFTHHPAAATQQHHTPQAQPYQPQQHLPIPQQQQQPSPQHPPQAHTAPISLQQGVPATQHAQPHQQQPHQQQPHQQAPYQHTPATAAGVVAATAAAAEAGPAPAEQKSLLSRAKQYANEMVQKLANYFESKLPPQVIDDVKQIGQTMAKSGVRETPIPAENLPERSLEGPQRGQQQTVQRG